MSETRTMPGARGGRGKKWVVTAMALTLAAGVALSAGARPEHGPGMGGMGMMMGPPGLIGPHLDRMLDSVKATDAQRSQIHQIADAAAADMKSQIASREALHERAMQVFTAPNVDANAAEAVRQQMLQQHDQSSRRMLQAMLDVSRVLSPEQRTQLAERMKKHAEMMKQRMQQHGEAPR